MLSTIIDWIAAHPYQVVGLVLPIVIPLALFQILPLLVLMERRGAAMIQDRAGPNRAYIPIPFLNVKVRGFGMIFNLTDAVKLLFKEHFTPPFVHKGYYRIAPAIPLITGLLTPALIPWFSPIVYQGGVLSGQTIDANSGILMLFAMASLSVYGVVLGSWASNSKYSLLGGMRASAMMISYEVSMGLSVIGMLMIVGSVSLTDVVEWQGQHTWGFVVQPVGFLLFLVSMFAECNRNPFDVAEGESELVAGFHTEFNGVKFMLYMSAEYLHMIVASVLIATVYFGGYQLLPIPGFGPEWVKAHVGQVLAIGLVGMALGLLGFVWVIKNRKAIHARSDSNPQDKAERAKEYGLYMAVFTLAGLGLLGAAGASWALINIERLGQGWIDFITAAVQFNIVIAKALLFCWLFVWVRWTIPRFRYDQIMDLGWKVLLNVALVNLLVTAVVAKLIG